MRLNVNKNKILAHWLFISVLTILFSIWMVIDNVGDYIVARKSRNRNRIIVSENLLCNSSADLMAGTINLIIGLGSKWLVPNWREVAQLGLSAVLYIRLGVAILRRINRERIR